jgi:hypothetical protein
MERLRTEHPSMAGHWYAKDGRPCYTIIGKNGKERNTTLADARKEDLVPSVTTIIGCASKPMLQRWIQDQVLFSALTITRLENEPEEDYIERIRTDAGEQAQKARERGTQIHAWVQMGFEGEKIPEEGKKFYESAKATLEKECGVQEWTCELSFSNGRVGGKVDIQNNLYVVDFKSTDKPVDNLKTWDDHHQQLAAYDQNLGRKCGILYINTLTAESILVWVTPEELERGRKMFEALTDYWYSKTGLQSNT